ncbi:fungal-specific transcription factor domain-containing protein [Dipodascopsis uninucleata]
MEAQFYLPIYSAQCREPMAAVSMNFCGEILKYKEGNLVSVQRRKRSRQGCLTCVKRKIRCDESHPICQRCVKASRSCEWRPTNLRTGSSRHKTPVVSTCRRSVTPIDEPEDHMFSEAPVLNNSLSVEKCKNPLMAEVDQSLDNVSLNIVSQNPAIRQVSDNILWFSDLLEENISEVISKSSCTSPENFEANSESPQNEENAEEIQSDSFESCGNLIDPIDNEFDNGFNSAVSNSIDNLLQLPELFNSDAEFDRDSTMTVEPEHERALDIEKNFWNILLPNLLEKVLLDHFLLQVTPPIIVSVISESKWIGIRKLLVKLCHSSPLIYNSVLAFSELHLSRQSQRIMDTSFYFNGVRYLKDALENAKSVGHIERCSMRNLLAALFFFTYIDLILDPGRETTRSVPSYLRDAYAVVRSSEWCRLSDTDSIECQLLSWLRLLDARAVLAGGDGLFITENEDNSYNMLSRNQSSERHYEIPNGSFQRFEGLVSTIIPSVDDALYDLIIQPGIAFFQKTQSYMRRICFVDMWHRPRGSVADEIEVIRIAESISHDLRLLWDLRPQLIDYCLEGKMTSLQLSPTIFKSIERNYRVYACAYYAALIHLHRIAYKYFDASDEVKEAIKVILQNAKILANEDLLSSSMMWPLLLCGMEISDPEDRSWIVAQIKSLDKSTANATITARVLEEIHRRQDKSEVRVDLRLVMMDIYKKPFAVL